MEFLKQYEILFKKARTDLKVAKNILEDFENGDDELDLEVVMFHLQQCSEKLLKSILAFNKQHFLKTHDIKNLIFTCTENNIDLIDNINILIPLTDYAVEGRYAVIHDDLDDGDKYIKILNELLEFVKKEIK
jgi:HEPN domain-containing protein